MVPLCYLKWEHARLLEELREHSDSRSGAARRETEPVITLTLSPAIVVIDIEEEVTTSATTSTHTTTVGAFLNRFEEENREERGLVREGTEWLVKRGSYLFESLLGLYTLCWILVGVRLNQIFAQSDGEDRSEGFEEAPRRRRARIADPTRDRPGGAALGGILRRPRMGP